ncbi:hypothetical protein O181_075896 [Austropuccinia psidii MF-1]|uniref:Uncharacterized protein n=1 Tax=Austropuccinia psidii MF-1 TaxID=1389203 RepID=A0A9Q3FFC0_9BASI|nr:hypothetical protein [Austropuccinia psidii MF-1]
MQEEGSDGTEGVPSPVGKSQCTGGPALAQANQPASNQSKPYSLAIMKQMIQIMTNIQEDLRPKAFNTTSMKAPECFDGIQPFKVRRFIQSFQLIFHNDQANFSRLVSRIGDWGERALIHHFRKGVASRILNQLASHPSRIDSLQDLMDITLELDNRYHERQKENGHFQEKNPEASKSNSSHPQNSSSSNQKKKKNLNKRDKPHSSFLIKSFKLIGSEKERRLKEGIFPYCGGNHILESCFKRPQNQLSQPL